MSVAVTKSPSKLVLTGSGVLVAGLIVLAVIWWPGEDPATKPQPFLIAWNSGSLESLADQLHPDEIKLMGASQSQIRNFLRGLKWQGEISFLSIPGPEHGRHGFTMSFVDKSNRRIEADLVPNGKSWHVGLGRTLLTACSIQENRAKCLEEIADGMDANGIKMLASVEYKLGATAAMIRKVPSDPREAFQPIHMLLNKSPR